MSKVFLEEHIVTMVGTLLVDVRIALSKPWTVLFGPSGAGKSTVLRHLAGLETGDAWRRRAPLAAQRPALFPHKTVRENLLFGVSHFPSGAKAPWQNEIYNGRAEARPLPSATFSATAEGRLEELVGLFQIGELLERMPSQISGGQAQRVSVARALMPAGSRVVLLDEPFTGVELGLRKELLLGLREWTATHGLPVLMVTHEVADCLLLEAEVIQLHEGRVVAQGPAGVVLAEERERLLESLRG